MNEDFVTFDLAKKLKEKGFTCKYPFAMYNEDGDFCALYTSADILEVDSDGLQMRDYYCFVDFDGYDCIAPTISQVLKWLREEKKIHVLIAPMLKHSSATYHWGCEIYDISRMSETVFYKESLFNMSSHNEAALSGIKYVIDNLI